MLCIADRPEPSGGRKILELVNVFDWSSAAYSSIVRLYESRMVQLGKVIQESGSREALQKELEDDDHKKIMRVKDTASVR